MSKMKKAAGDAPATASESEAPKKFTYKVSEGSFFFDGEEYNEGDTIEIDEGTSRRIIEEDGVKLTLEE